MSTTVAVKPTVIEQGAKDNLGAAIAALYAALKDSDLGEFDDHIDAALNEINEACAIQGFTPVSGRQ
jgi:hypothetical protein